MGKDRATMAVLSRCVVPIVLAVLVLGGCSGGDSGSPSNRVREGTTPADTVTLGYFPNATHAPAIVGVALPDSRERLAAALSHLQPRYVLPSHQDDFFRPLSAGFQFAPLSDFPRVQRESAQQNRSRLILLDYFRPWTLPKAASSKLQNPNPKNS